MKRIFKIASAVAHFAFRCTPIAYAALILLLTIAFGYDYRRFPDNDIWRGHWAGCGNFDALSGPDRYGKKNYLSLEINDRENGQFFVSGQLILSDASYAALIASSAKMHVSLDSLRSPAAFFGHIPIGLELDNDKLSRRWDNEVVIPIKEHRLYPRGAMTDFPLDEYRIGFSPVLYVSKPGDKVSRPYVLDTAITNVRLSNSMVVRKAKTWSDYVEDVKLNTEEMTNRYSEGECPLIIERSRWYMDMVALLIVLLFAPAIYLLYRPDDHPGVDLIAVILGVASIRQFLFGGISDWTLYTIDMIFVLVASLTALIPLINIYRKLRRPLSNPPDGKNTRNRQSSATGSGVSSE